MGKKFTVNYGETFQTKDKVYHKISVSIRNEFQESPAIIQGTLGMAKVQVDKFKEKVLEGK